jgi:rhodanese-related sulfurtransferase
MTPLEAYGMLRNDFAVLVDVREADELKDGMAAPAKWVPTSKIEKNDPEWQQFVAQLPKDKQIIFYCAVGVRAGKAAAKLAEQGFRTGNIGGYTDWLKAGLPTKKPQS